MIGPLTNHLWQSTVFALGAALLTVLFRHSRAQVRYWLWFSASIKFFVPFALLIALTAFEILVSALQAFIFTILTGVYIGLSMHPEH